MCYSVADGIVKMVYANLFNIILNNIAQCTADTNVPEFDSRDVCPYLSVGQHSRERTQKILLPDSEIGFILKLGTGDFFRDARA